MFFIIEHKKHGNKIDIVGRKQKKNYVQYFSLSLLIGQHGDQQDSHQVWVVSAKVAPTLSVGHLRGICLDEGDCASLQQLSRVHVCQREYVTDGFHHGRREREFTEFLTKIREILIL
jgi:hypothetical protein